MFKKVCYVDTETTGLDPVKNDVIEIGLILEVNGRVKDEMKINCKPYDFNSVDPSALAVHGYTIEDLQSFQPPRVALRTVVAFLGGCCDKYDKTDKYYPAGFRVDFDMNFLSSWFKKGGDNYFGSWFNGKALDPLHILRFWDYMGIIDLPSYKLQMVCDYFKIPIVAHDAMSDIRATREIIRRICSMPMNSKNVIEHMLKEAVV
jgi:DNA polymerase III epsilon subunit-like protein